MKNNREKIVVRNAKENEEIIDIFTKQDMKRSKKFEHIMTFEELKNEDKLALAEAYRVYELLRPEEKELIPKKIVDTYSRKKKVVKQLQ